MTKYEAGLMYIKEHHLEEYFILNKFDSDSPNSAEK